MEKKQMFLLKEQIKGTYQTILWLAFIKSNETSSAAKFVDQKQNGRKMNYFTWTITGKLDDFDPGYHLYDWIPSYYEWIFRLKLAELLLGMCAMVGVRSCQCPPRWQQTLE